MSFADTLLRAFLTAAHQLLKTGWFVRRPQTLGAHALVLTPENKLVLVKLRYARGWRLPGGGRDAKEDARAAVLRELREEIGMVSHGAVRLAAELEQHVNIRRGLASLFVVQDVRYRPRWSWEVESIVEANFDDLPDDLAPISRQWIDAVVPKL